MHQAAPRVRVFAAFERARRLDRRGAQRRRQTEQQRHARGQRQAESQHAPVRRKKQARRIVRRIDPADDERRGPPGEQRAASRPRGTRAMRFPPAPVAPDAIVPRRSRRAAPSRAPAPPPEPSSGWRRWRTQSAAPAPPARPEPRASGGSRSAGRRRQRPRAPAIRVWLRKLSILCLVMPVKPFALSCFECPRGRVQLRANRFDGDTRLQPRQRPVPGRVVSAQRRDASSWARRCRSPCRSRCR